MKKSSRVLKSFVVFSLLLMTLLWANQFVYAFDFRDTIEVIGDETELENYSSNIHADAEGRGGARNITSAIFFIIDFIKYTLGSLVVLMLIINSVQLITAGKESEEKVTKEKEYLKYALMGLVFVFVAEEAIKLAFFGTEGEVLRSEESAAEFALAGSDIIKGIYSFVEIFIGVIAVFMIVYSGFQMLVGAGSEEAATAGKKRIFVAIVGLAIIGLSELIVKDIIFKNQGRDIDSERGREVIVGITNFIASTMAVIAVFTLIYAGFLYILNFGNDEMVNKAKKIIFGSIAGLVLAAGAFALVSTVIPLQGAQ